MEAAGGQPEPESQVEGQQEAPEAGENPRGHEKPLGPLTWEQGLFLDAWTNTKKQVRAGGWGKSLGPGSGPGSGQHHRPLLLRSGAQGCWGCWWAPTRSLSLQF